MEKKKLILAVVPIVLGVVIVLGASSTARAGVCTAGARVEALEKSGDTNWRKGTVKKEGSGMCFICLDSKDPGYDPKCEDSWVQMQNVKALSDKGANEKPK